MEQQTLRPTSWLAAFGLSVDTKSQVFCECWKGKNLGRPLSLFLIPYASPGLFVMPF